MGAGGDARPCNLVGLSLKWPRRMDDHAWCELLQGMGEGAIVDVYLVGSQARVRFGPQLGNQSPRCRA